MTATIPTEMNAHIVALRKSKFLTQKQVAKATGYTQRTILQVEGSTRKVTTRMLMKFAELFDTTPDSMLAVCVGKPTVDDTPVTFDWEKIYAEHTSGWPFYAKRTLESLMSYWMNTTNDEEVKAATMDWQLVTVTKDHRGDDFNSVFKVADPHAEGMLEIKNGHFTSVTSYSDSGIDYYVNVGSYTPFTRKEEG